MGQQLYTRGKDGCLHLCVHKHDKSTPYYLHENRNKILCTNLTRVVEEYCNDLEKKLHVMLWAYRTVYKFFIGTTPLNSIFGLVTILPIDFLVPTLHIAASLKSTSHSCFDKIEKLEQLDE